VQDDLADWKREAAVMGGVHEDAFLTIAVTDISLMEPTAFWTSSTTSSLMTTL
jgi:hypothetical protein